MTVPMSPRRRAAARWLRAPQPDAVLATIVIADLLTGILVGLGLALAKLLYTFSHLGLRLAADNGRTVLYLNGAATFIRLPKLAAILQEVPASTELHVHFEELTYIDHGCMDLLINWEKQHAATGGRLVVDWESLTARFRPYGQDPGEDHGRPAPMSAPEPPAGSVFPIKAILHPTDFSEHAKFAFQQACAMAREHGEVAGQKVDVGLIGTCTNGRLDDLRQAAAILKGKRIARGVRLVITPAWRQIYLAAAREGLIEQLTAAGASVEAASCGTCVGITNHLISGDGEVVISSANRNFKGRLGNSQSEIWIGSAATVAASALTGRITDPREVAGGTWRAVA